MIGNLRVMARSEHQDGADSGPSAARQRADRFMATGRITVPGIRFDPVSARLRPESTPTLLEILEILRGHPELQVIIESHTDEGEDAAASQQLSERRAAAIQAYLVADGGVATARLSAVGWGGSRPVGPNDTPEGRHQNRRVELVLRQP
jgi:outer membrane protein OmpA-like peptidoglycan-associated protein